MYSRLCFRHQNYLADVQHFNTAPHNLTNCEKFDTIICLDAARMISLCFGDYALAALFIKIHHQLIEGGHFVLGVHSWSTYKQHKLKVDKLKIKTEQHLKPGLYAKYLSQLGFELQSCSKMSNVFELLQFSK